MTGHAPGPDSPRAVASKRDRRNLLAAIRMALRVESAAVRHNTQTFNRGRYAAVAALPDYDALKDRARGIKELSIKRLPELVTTLEASVKHNGGCFFLAPDATAACRYISDVCRAAGARRVVKGKSMTSEEVGLNRALEAHGMEVAETDLAEFILQAADEQPSHIIAPAVHYSRERITALFQRVFRCAEPLDTGEALTVFARERLREKFLAAGAGISGANFIAADTATLVLVESEANIRMTSLMPPLYIVIAGVEKLVPTRADLAPFIELLAASGTGQPMTSYTSVISPPLNHAPVLTAGPAPPPRQFHLVMVDNGRLKMRDDPVMREALYCVRCSACLNACANFQTVGGHAFGGETYSGGIGGAWEAGTRGLESARFAELCTGCSRCVPQCPVRIDIPWLNTVLRSRLAQQDARAPGVLGASPQKQFFGRYDAAAKWASRLAAAVNAVSALSITRVALEMLFSVDRRRLLPRFAAHTLRESAPRKPRAAAAAKRVVLFADVFTNYHSPERGLATRRLLSAMGVDVVVSDPSPDGRASFSQGLLDTAAVQARATAALLKDYLDEGRDIIVVEPSVLAMFRMEYRHLLDRPEESGLLAELRARSFDPCEHLWRLLQERGLDPAGVFPAAGDPRVNRLFLHAHCQQRTIGAAAPTEALLRACGFDVVSSQVECCGMAGSFGYKKEFYELSMAVAEDLFAQVRRAERDGPRTLVASGTSCVEQLQAGFARKVVHPMELLAGMVQAGAITEE